MLYLLKVNMLLLAGAIGSFLLLLAHSQMQFQHSIVGALLPRFVLSMAHRKAVSELVSRDHMLIISSTASHLTSLRV